ncbi:methionine synthase [Corynebacterium phoceense]|uniref:Methionine synthase n=1 Tax=Corynebacterium phoceense TaxID=1686286 RepID=A0A540R7H0_9CORY|nr:MULTISPECIES: methionine synthase [Corynebacterium]MCQ9330091.1 methionine synthase [Corynebacterium phoceense]MCQ9347248.1 methionine synthase [Corynebacterium phoceense]OFN40781.1 methionine synthase [Corynebacterium sp. HMSC072G08]TQE43690.1 methionine synthase [Corynebacterium phoceense]
MTGFGLGPMPGTSMSEAADIVMGETGALPHLPQLPDRGLGSDAIGRTAGLLETLTVDRGPRSWQMAARPQRETRRVWDRMERDLDAIVEVWGEHVPRVKIQAVGPWTLAAAVELSNGHRVITDRGAREDLHAALLEGIQAHSAEVARRFNAEVALQLDEPQLADALAGRIPGTTDFDPIRAVPEEVAIARLEELGADYLRAGNLWPLASAGTLLVDFAGLDTPANLDGLGEHLEASRRVGLALDPRTFTDARAAAIAVAQHVDRLGHSRELLVTHVDINPWPVRDAARDYRFAAEVAGMLERDAGDL